MAAFTIRQKVASDSFKLRLGVYSLISGIAYVSIQLNQMRYTPVIKRSRVFGICFLNAAMLACPDHTSIHLTFALLCYCWSPKCNHGLQGVFFLVLSYVSETLVVIQKVTLCSSPLVYCYVGGHFQSVLLDPKWQWYVSALFSKPCVITQRV